MGFWDRLTGKGLVPLRGGQVTLEDTPKPFENKPNNDRYEMYSRPAKPGVVADSFAYHDTVGRYWEPMVQRSNANCAAGSCLGVTFTTAGDGTVRLHQPLTRRSNHAGFPNDQMHGTETINLFDPTIADPVHPGQIVVKAPWLGRQQGGEVILPAPVQLENGYQLLLYLAGLPEDEGGGLVMDFPWSEGGNMIYMTVPDVKANFKPGVWAHGHLSGNRSDGYAQVLYSYLRHEGFKPDVAWELVKSMGSAATKVGGVWVAPLPPPPASWPAWALVGVGLGSAAALAWVTTWLLKRGD